MIKATLLSAFCIVHTLVLWIPERVIWLIGLVLLPLFITFRRYGNECRSNGWKFCTLPWGWLPWDNHDDGCLGDREGNWVKLLAEEKGLPFDFNLADKFWPIYRYIGLRNPCHNLSKLGLYSCDLSKVTKVRFWGTKDVDNRLGEDGKVKSGYQVVLAAGPRLYFRVGIYCVLAFSTKKCLRLRLGYKVTPSDEGAPAGIRTWTLSFSPWKSVLVGW